MALDIKLRQGSNRVFVVLGDGELDEGSIWEGCLVAAAHHLDNLTVIVDRNRFQANLRTEDLLPLEPLQEKFAAFGWPTVRIDGHDHGQLSRAFEVLPLRPGAPGAIIADTVRGRGVPSIEGRADRWFMRLDPEQVEAYLAELHGARPRVAEVVPLFVR